MGTISISITDTKTGIISANFNIADDGIERIYNTLKTIYEEGDNLPELDEEGEPITRDKVVYTLQDVTSRIGHEFVHNLVNSVLDHERRLLMRNIPIKPIKVT